MRTALIHLTVLLCILMQVVYGATYRTGLVLCVPLPPLAGHAHDEGAGDEHEGVCHHHHAINDRATHQPPAGSMECPCCVDLEMPDSTMPPARIAAAGDGGVSLAVSVDLPCAILSGPEFGFARAWERGPAHPPDRVSSRVASGLKTTRLLI